LADAYQRNHDISPTTYGQLRNAAQLLTRFAGGSLNPADLSADLVNAWLVSRKNAGLAAITLKGNRTSIRMLWRLAHELGLAPPVGKVRCIKVPHGIPTAFRLDDLKKLLAAAAKERLRWRYWRIEKRLYWRAFLLAAYDSGLRLSDVLAIRWQSIEWTGSGDGAMPLVQQKTGHLHVVHFYEETMRALAACQKSGIERDVIFPPLSRARWYQHFKRLCRAAGVKGTSRYLRRSGASYIAAEHGESAASRFLGHRTPELAQRKLHRSAHRRAEVVHAAGTHGRSRGRKGRCDVINHRFHGFNDSNLGGQIIKRAGRLKIEIYRHSPSDGTCSAEFELCGSIGDDLDTDPADVAAQKQTTDDLQFLMELIETFQRGRRKPPEADVV
jgi:integrase